MRAILDTNILIHRESSVVVHNDIGSLFNWLDRLGYEKLIHPISVEEINRHRDEKVRASFKAKIASYNVIKIPSKIAPKIQDIINNSDRDDNDRNDSLILNEVFSGKVDILITEDRKILRKSEELNISEKVYNIDSFLEKVFAENPDLIEYKVLSVKRTLFGTLDVKNSFFDSFRKNYSGFDDWFNRKSDESAYVCFNENDLLAFLYIKKEDEREVYSDITPNFSKKKRLRGCTKTNLLI